MRNTKSSSIVFLTDRADGQGSNPVQARNRRILWFACALELIFCCCCTAVPSVNREDQRGTSQANSNTSASDDKLIASGFFNATPEEEKEAWLLFTKSRQYRVAGENDFHLPEAAKKNRSGDLDRAIEHPFVGGDINHDGAYNDFAVIVVDTTKNEADRFGVVIFNQQATRKGSYETHWLYRQQDLSKTVMEWWSGGLAIDRYNEDGSYQSCYVNWNGRLKTYTCDKDFKK